MTVLRWGLIGAGRIARQFAHDMPFTDNAVLKAAAARSYERAAAFAAEFGIERAYGSYEEIFADPHIDAIYVATPHSHHLSQCKAALEAGKAVLCEKPLVLDPQQCNELIAAHARSDRYLIEGMWTWFLPAIKEARRWVEDGRIGNLLHVKADFGYPLPYSPEAREYDSKLGGGSTLEMGVYTHYITRLFNRAPRDSLQVCGRLAPNGVENDVSAIFHMPDMIATLGSSFRCRLKNSAFIIGDQGYIEIPDFFRAFECSLFQIDERIDHFRDDRKTFGFEHEIAEVSADILEGRRMSERIPLDLSLQIQEEMAAIKLALGAA